METSFRKIQQPLCASFTNCKTSFRKIQQPLCASFTHCNSNDRTSLQTIQVEIPLSRRNNLVHYLPFFSKSQNFNR